MINSMLFVTGVSSKIFMRGSRGGTEGKTPLKYHKNIGSLCTTCPDPLKNHKDTKSAFHVGPSSARQRNTIQIMFCWRADKGTLIVVF